MVKKYRISFKSDNNSENVFNNCARNLNSVNIFWSFVIPRWYLIYTISMVSVTVKYCWLFVLLSWNIALDIGCMLLDILSKRIENLNDTVSDCLI